MKPIIVFALFLFASFAPFATAQNRDIETVITGQIEALSADDFGAAFEFASPNIQRQFGSADRFGEMVRQGFPMVWRATNITFLDQTQHANATWQRVKVTDVNGLTHLLDYQMVAGPDGWQINAVLLVPVLGVAT